MAGTEPGREPPAAAPRWVKVSGIVVGVVIVVALVLVLTGHHGPERHLRGDEAQVHDGVVQADPGLAHSRSATSVPERK